MDFQIDNVVVNSVLYAHVLMCAVLIVLMFLYNLYIPEHTQECTQECVQECVYNCSKKMNSNSNYHYPHIY
jgi:hypothetical protein